VFAVAATFARVGKVTTAIATPKAQKRISLFILNSPKIEIVEPGTDVETPPLSRQQ
jgi:hypothetical protein